MRLRMMGIPGARKFPLADSFSIWKGDDHVECWIARMGSKFGYKMIHGSMYLLARGFKSLAACRRDATKEGREWVGKSRGTRRISRP